MSSSESSVIGAHLVRTIPLANSIVEIAGRRTDWIHVPVPRDRSDDEYFAPFETLPDTKIYLGLVHHTDGAEGTRKRIEAASRHVSNLGVATECGLGRRPADTVEHLLRVHAEVAAPVAGRKGVNA